MAVPVHVFGGFLGAGKTSALRATLARLPAGEQVAVVMNDFGDSGLRDLGDERVALSEIEGVCLCCTAPEGFQATVGRILEEARPTRIFVEPMGLAHPSDLVDTLRRAPYREAIEVAPLVVLVDPHVLATSPDPEIRAQAALADVLVANREDLATDEERAAFQRWAASLWPPPLRVVVTRHGEIPLEVLGWPEGEGPRARNGSSHDHDHDHDHDHGHVGRAWRWAPEVVFDRVRLLEALGRAAAVEGFSRLKGIVRTDQGVERVEIAGGRVHASASAWRRDSRLDALVRDGVGLDELDVALGAAIRPAGGADGSTLEFALPDGSVRVFDQAALAALPDGVPDTSALVPGREGVAARVASLLAELGLEEGLEAVVVARDGYVTPLVPLEALTAGLLVHTLGGAPLPDKHGGPVRLLIPGDAGPGGPCANVKGVVRIATRRRAADPGRVR